jgi:hypothetical protein
MSTRYHDADAMDKSLWIRVWALGFEPLKCHSFIRTPAESRKVWESQKIRSPTGLLLQDLSAGILVSPADESCRLLGRLLMDSCHCGYKL